MKMQAWWWLLADTLRMMVIDEVQLYEQVKHAGAYLLIMIDTLMTSCITEVWPAEWYTYSYGDLDDWWLDKQCWWADHAESHDEQWRGRAAVLMRVLSRWLAVLTSSRTDWRNRWVDVTVSFHCKCKLVLLLRLGYLKPFLAWSKKTRQGPGCRVGALCISRFWFFLNGCSRTKTNIKRLQIYMMWCSSMLWLLMI